MVVKPKEIEPPWVYAPEIEPACAFWRQEGELWFHYVWLPFWESLSPSEKEKYLVKWDVPEIWRKYSYHINPAFREWVDSLDDPDEMSEDANPNLNQPPSRDKNCLIPIKCPLLFSFLVIVIATIAWLVFA
jgi:hypothetical protein